MTDLYIRCTGSDCILSEASKDSALYTVVKFAKTGQGFSYRGVPGLIAV